MRIAMIGQKRTGSREGGVEVVVTELACRMAALGHEVTCYDRKGSAAMGAAGRSASDDRLHDYKGVHVEPVRTVDARGLAALSSSFFATLAAVKARPDVIHYHAEGPCVPLRLAHAKGIRTVATIHGLDWQRAKWGGLASAYIKLGERTAAKYADEVVVLSKPAQEYFQTEYGRKTALVPNGMEPAERLRAQVICERWGLTSGGYALYLGRIVPEKGLHYLIEAWSGLDTEMPLVVAGGGSDTDEYEARCRIQAAQDSRVLFTGYVEGRALEELYSNAYLYVLPSDVEGMPMSLLEAMAHGCCCVTSDIPECADVLAGAGATFPKGDVAGLRGKLAELLSDPSRAADLGHAARKRIEESCGWDAVVERTLGLYRSEPEGAATAEFEQAAPAFASRPRGSAVR